jgi:hypothetical protein
MGTGDHRVFTFPGTVSHYQDGIQQAESLRRSAIDYRDTQSHSLAFERPDKTVDPVVRLLEARAVAIQGNGYVRAQFLEQEIIIYTPDVIHVSETIDTLLPRARQILNPGGMRIQGAGGTGKDTVIRIFQRKYPPYHTDGTFCTPILVVTFDARLSQSAILQDLLGQAQGLYNRSASIKNLEDCLLEAIVSRYTMAIAFNESQHILPVSDPRKRTQSRQAGATGDWFKRFLDKIRIPVFMFGTPGWDDVFELDPQLATRLTHRFMFSELKSDATFVGVLQALDEAIPMPEPAGLGKREMADPIYRVCCGNWRRLTTLLKEAIILATESGSVRIEREHLRRAYRIQFGLEGNPFGPLTRK